MPILNKTFVPFGVWAQAYLSLATHPVKIAIEREDKLVSTYETALRGPDFLEANYSFLERLVKFLIWSRGGNIVYICGADDLAEKLTTEYSPEGVRAFDCSFMETLYKAPLKIIAVPESKFPAAKERTLPIGGHKNGNRIGFDAGGSNKKVVAISSGNMVYSDEVPWTPKEHEDPTYHFDEIVSSLKSAAQHLETVDAVGISSAGTFVGNELMTSSLFVSVPAEKRVSTNTIYERACAELGCSQFAAVNDGDAAALAGFLETGSGNVFGLSLGTSEAVGYVNHKGNVLGWINELAFAPVDLDSNAPVDPWSGDRGVGATYLSQDAVVLLAASAGIKLADYGTPAEKQLAVQTLAENGHDGAQNVYRTIGCFLAHTLVLYRMFYQIDMLLVLGGVVSGAGGELLMKECRAVLQEEYPEIADSVRICFPDENMRVIGQAIAAASLPEV